MDDDEIFNCNFKIVDKSIIDIERKIKTYLRRYSVNKPTEKDIERYSDRYNESVLTNNENIKKYILPSILPEELAMNFGEDCNKTFEEVDSAETVIESVDLSEDSDDDEKDSEEDIDDDYKIRAEDDENTGSSDEGDKDEGVF